MVVEEFQQKEELIKSKEASEAASAAKGEFLSVMSHEIRTPLNGLIGGCAFLEKTVLDNEQSKHICLIKESSQQLLTLVNDILDFSKIESGKIELEKRPVDLVQLIQDLLPIFSADNQDKNIRLDFEGPGTQLPVVLCDPLRLKQVIINLISNAVKFTSQGGVSVSIKSVGVQNNRFSFIIRVHDTGIGIDKNKAGELFQSFTQIDTSTTRNYGGTGLGLAISKQLTELMGGKSGLKVSWVWAPVFLFSLNLKYLILERMTWLLRTRIQMVLICRQQTSCWLKTPRLTWL